MMILYNAFFYDESSLYSFWDKLHARSVYVWGRDHIPILLKRLISFFEYISNRIGQSYNLFFANKYQTVITTT